MDFLSVLKVRIAGGGMLSAIVCMKKVCDKVCVLKYFGSTTKMQIEYTVKNTENTIMSSNLSILI